MTLNRQPSPAVITTLWVVIGALLIVGVGGAFAVSSPGSQRATAADSAAVAGAAAVARAQPNYRFAFVIVTSVAGQSFKLTTEGVSEPAKHRSSTTDTIPSTKGQVSLHLVQENTTGFAEVPANRRAEANGKQWLKFDIGALSATGLTTDPAAYLDAVTAGAKITVVGHEKLGGARTTHYRADVSSAKALEQIPVLATQLRGAAATSIPVDLWIDNAGRPRKFTEHGDLQGLSFNAQLTFAHFDAAPAVAIPLPADTLAVDSVQRLLDLATSRAAAA